MRYEITVKGTLDPGWSDWFNGMAVTVEPATHGQPQTRLAGPVGDQAALRGMLNKLWDLNLTLISVRRIEASQEEPC
jgi:hypothetical protein